MADSPLIRDISDTARWMAAYREQETSRPDALFRDPLAGRLAGERGRAIAQRMKGRDAWPFTARTLEFDEAITRFVAAGADAVVNLAAGLDTRPYRLKLPTSMRWIEIDLPAIFAEKDQALASELPICALERVPLDLADVGARRATFARIGENAREAVVMSEGLLGYLTEEHVAALADDLAAVQTFRHWVFDMVSPVLLRMLKRTFAKLDIGMPPVYFAPAEGPAFFEQHGWRVASARSLLRVAAKHKRVNWFMRLVARLPDSQGKPSRQPWGGVCVLER